MNSLRSLSKYTALALPEFEVRFSPQEGTFARPYAGVLTATGVTSTPRGPHHVEMRQAFAVRAFPVSGISDESSRMEAHRVERLLWQAFAQGIDAPSFSPRSNRAHPLRVPLYSYEGVGLYETVPESARIGYLRVVEPPTFEVIPDSNAGTFAVVGDLRVAWSESIAVPAGGPLAVRVAASRAA